MVQQVNHDELESRIRLCYEADQPLFIHGTTGIGKSETVKAVAQDKAEELGKEFVCWEDVKDNPEHEGQVDKDEVYANPSDYFMFVDERLVQSDPTDVKGIPDTRDDVTKWNPPEWIDYMSMDDAHGMIFCDELNHAPQMVQKAYFSLILDRKVDTNRISENVFLLAAGNREEDKAGVVTMPSSLRNRFGHVELEPPVAGKEGNWTEWALENDLHGSVVGFLSSQLGQSHLFEFTEENRDATSFATPRTWKMASDAIKSSGVQTPEQISAVAEVFIGDVASNFRGYLQTRDELDIEGFLENPALVGERIAGDKADVDVKHALVSALAEEYRTNPDSLESIIEISSELDAEFSSFLLSMCRKYNEDHFTRIARNNETFAEFADEYYNYLF